MYCIDIFTNQIVDKYTFTNPEIPQTIKYCTFYFGKYIVVGTSGTSKVFVFSLTKDRKFFNNFQVETDYSINTIISFQEKYLIVGSNDYIQVFIVNTSLPHLQFICEFDCSSYIKRISS